jgi:hypothetical protein
MAQNVNENELQGQTKQLMDGPLKHIRAAALAAALVPLASVFATPAAAQTACASGGVCGTVFNDVNGNGLQDAGEPGIEGVKVVVCQLCNLTDNIETETGPTGTYSVDVLYGTTTVAVLIPTGGQASPPNVNGNSSDGTDSDGVPNGGGYSVATVIANGSPTDFGFVSSSASNPGTGTPGYWKNHPEAWPAIPIIVGGVTYTKALAISWLSKTGKDKTVTMFQSLLSAMLSVAVGNDGSCINTSITQGNTWLATYPLGSNVAGSSYAWSIGQPIQQTLDAYDNGLLCAPHRN